MTKASRGLGIAGIIVGLLTGFLLMVVTALSVWGGDPERAGNAFVLWIIAYVGAIVAFVFMWRGAKWGAPTLAGAGVVQLGALAWSFGGFDPTLAAYLVFPVGPLLFIVAGVLGWKRPASPTDGSS